MLVSELIRRLEQLPEGAEVKVNCTFSDSRNVPLLAVIYDANQITVILQDHITEIKPREFVSHDGCKYEVPWGSTIRR